MDELTAPAFYTPLGGQHYASTERTSGPWSPKLQHAGPPCALLARELERCQPRAGALISRVTFELLGPVPVDDVELHAEVERPGRNVELLRAELRAGGATVLRAAAWRLTTAPVDAGPPEAQPPPLPPEAGPVPAAIAESGYLRSVEWRAASGNWHEPGPATVWARPRVPLIEGEVMTGLQRTLAVCDSVSGISAALPWDRWLFINTDLSVHIAREPQGEWICLNGVTRVASGGVGLATGELGDARGYFGRSAQTLLVREGGVPNG